MGLAKSVSGALSLWKSAGALGIGFIDRSKYALCWYLTRGALKRIAPDFFILKLPGGVRTALRPNGTDINTISDIFGRRIYQEQHTGITRVLDLGANIGLATTFFASQYPAAEFACIEPFPGNLKILRENVRLNEIRATVFEGVVGVDPGHNDLHVGCAPDMFSLTPVSESTDLLRVRMFSVPEVLETLGWDEVDLMKIDIEGYEKILLSQGNGWLDKVRVIIGEAHGHVAYGMDEVRADLEPMGFQVTLKSFDPVYGLTVFEARRR